MLGLPCPEHGEAGQQTRGEARLTVPPPPIRISLRNSNEQCSLVLWCTRSGFATARDYVTYGLQENDGSTRRKESEGQQQLHGGAGIRARLRSPRCYW
jgi:hypothetical protein